MNTNLFICQSGILTLIEAGDRPPETIQWMPPGQHKVTAWKGRVGGETVTLTVNVDAGTAERMNAVLQQLRSKAAAGEEDLPFFDFNHDDGEASFHPTEFYWGGNDPKLGGVRARGAWTKTGGEGVLGRGWRRFSPAFNANAAGEVTGSDVNMGGLVNRAAFKKIQATWAKAGADAPNHEPKASHMTPEEIAALQAKNRQLEQEIAALKSKETSVEHTQTIKAKDATILSLQDELKNKDAEILKGKKATAEAEVAQYVAKGKIPPANKEAIAFWTNSFVDDPVKAKAALDAVPGVSPEGRIITQATGGASTQGAAGEHAFIVKAKAVAAERKIDLAQAQAELARTREGAELYADFRAKL